MTNLSSIPTSGKKAATGLADVIGQEKNQRIARDCLRDLMLFNNALEMEMQSIQVAQRAGKPVDSELFAKMTVVKEKYQYAMSGFQALNDDMQRHALTSLADAIQDLMFLLHSNRNH